MAWIYWPCVAVMGLVGLKNIGYSRNDRQRPSNTADLQIFYHLILY